jgi:polar amino acid transport system substrate-binding protein
MTELLLDTPLTREQREYIEIMRDSSQVLLTLINDILDFSKIEAGKLALEMIEFSPLDVVESASEVFAPSARQKNLNLVLYVSPQVPSSARGDPVRLRQVLTNLISNAIKFTNAGEVEVRADLLEETEKFVMLLFQVRDTGIGLSEESLSHLFQPFSQAENSISRKYGGTGLGLAISRRLVELMDGEISVDSTVGKGSTFWFTTTFEKSELPAG